MNIMIRESFFFFRCNNTHLYEKKQIIIVYRSDMINMWINMNSFVKKNHPTINTFKQFKYRYFRISDIGIRKIDIIRIHDISRS